MTFDALKMAKEIQEQDEPAAALWAVLHMVDWPKIRMHAERHAVMQKAGIMPEDPCVALALVVGVAMGKIPYGGEEEGS